ncbi:hypothetical protein H8788_00890 [Parabacteroides faecis]|uniref:hypothetical protein n=1 Tax=Parabacteroides TaxID=375288 RepID=UPI000EFF7713|nr:MULTISPECIES: hypothetical protein [Parabacteroides]MBC8616287.1 hypothetical protein [Parabacteroides faecis]RHR98348.1 hypothetical protein DWW23_10835 [Parabacteroides sp. AF14-59]
MKKTIILCVLCLLSSMYAKVTAQAFWLPAVKDVNKNIRLLECSYNEAELKHCEEINSSSNWEVRTEQTMANGGKLYTFSFTARRDMKDAGVAVAFDRYGWTSDNYVMIPSSVYNGNRQRIVNRSYATGLDKTDYNRKDLALTSNPIPQLSPEFGAPSRLEINVSNAATPAMTMLERGKKSGTILLTDQGIEWDSQLLDHALIVEETPDRSIASFVVSAPGVRERKPEFIGFSKSPDQGIQVKKGDRIVIRVTEITFPCEDVPVLLARFMKDRKLHTAGEAPRNLMPMSEVLTRMVRNIDDRYYVGDQWEYYCPENADWISYGWIGGLMNTYPMLALGDEDHLRKVKNTFDFGLPRAKGKSGYYYDVLGSDGKVLYRDAAVNNPGIGLTRKNGDVLYWMVKQFMLLKEQGKANVIDAGWETNVRLLADAFVNTWKKQGTWGNYLDVETGNVAVYNTTSGAMAVAGLALASGYYNNPAYLEVACEAAADYYDNFALVGFTSGGCGDILQNADSETAVALLTSLMTLYEITGKEQYLKQAGDLANLCATWTVSFPYRLPEDTPLAKLGANLTGAVWASTQNKHGAPGFCTQSGDALFKLYRSTGDTSYAELLRDVIHAHAEGVQPNGKITERLTYCDADSRGSRGDGGKTGWNETNGAMMALEIPGIYVRTDIGSLYVFDHVEAKIVKQSNKQLVLQITNPTAYDATVTIFAENAEESARPLGDNAFLQWKDKVTVKAGKSVNYKLKTN